MDELEAFELSCQIEPLQSAANNSSTGGGSGSTSGSAKETRFKRRITPLSNHRKNDSIASTVSGSSNSSTPMLCETDGSLREEDDAVLSVGGGATSLNDSLRSRVSSASSNCSTPSLDTSISSSTPSRPDRTSTVSDNPSASPPQDPYRTPEFYIIRVSLETSTEATEGKQIFWAKGIINLPPPKKYILSVLMDWVGIFNIWMRPIISNSISYYDYLRSYLKVRHNF